MKKILCLILILSLCLSLSACLFDNSKKAFEVSREAFDKINTAYGMVNDYSKDIYEAWRLGVNSRSSYDDEYELEAFADELDIELIYIQQAIAKLLYKPNYEYGDWEMLKWFYNDSFFSACVDVASTAYVCRGDVDQITVLLQDAKTLMKQLSSDYSDYEHYPSLKEYFTNTLAFFDFCQNPEGTFEQVVETFNTYRNTARECFFDLNYVFEDDIGGMKDATSAESTDEESENAAVPEAEAIVPEEIAPEWGF